jgi:hypothetical protein
MTYATDIIHTTDLCEINADGVTFTFSVYENDCHPDDLPDLTLESARLGDLQLNREQVIAWLGAGEVARLEAACTPETWEAADFREYA